VIKLIKICKFEESRGEKVFQTFSASDGFNCTAEFFHKNTANGVVQMTIYTPYPAHGKDVGQNS